MENQQNEKKVSNLNDAISVLVQGVQLAQKAGVYSFEDSTVVGQALEFLKAESSRNNTETTEQPEMSVVDVTGE
jgi:hypothetical protein